MTLSPNTPCRLSRHDWQAIQVAFQRHFLQQDQLWLFGSRTDPNRRGGDIDLYVRTHIQCGKEAVEKKLAFVCDMQKAIGDQKIDVVLHVLALRHNLPVYQVATSEGIRMV